MLSGLRSYISEFDHADTKEIFVFSSQRQLIDSISINASVAKSQIREPFRDAQSKMRQSFDFSSRNVYVVVGKKDGQVVLPIYMDSSIAASVLGRYGFHYENSNGYTSLCIIEEKDQILAALQRVDGLGVKAIPTEEGYWLFLAPIPNQ